VQALAVALSALNAYTANGRNANGDGGSTASTVLSADGMLAIDSGPGSAIPFGASSHHTPCWNWSTRYSPLVGPDGALAARSKANR